MKKLTLSLFFAIACLLVFAAACAKCAERITDFKRYSGMQNTADKIDVVYDDNSGTPVCFSVTDKDDLKEIMDILLFEPLVRLDGEGNDGSHTSITVYQGEKSYSLSVSVNGENGVYYAFSTAKLQNAIAALAPSADG